METVITATGKIFGVDFVSMIPDPETLYIRIPGRKIEEIAAVFYNPDETRTLQYGKTVFSGFTHLSAIINEGDAFRLNLKKG